MPTLPPLNALKNTHGQDLPFTFAELIDKVMKKLNIETPITPPLEVINGANDNANRGVDVTLVRSTIHNLFITFGGTCLTETAICKRTGTMDIGGGF